MERDLTELLQGPVFRRIAANDVVFRAVTVEGGTVAWPGDVDIAPETLIWDGPEPVAGERPRPPATLRPRLPVG